MKIITFLTDMHLVVITGDRFCTYFAHLTAAFCQLTSQDSLSRQGRLKKDLVSNQHALLQVLWHFHPTSPVVDKYGSQ